MVTFLYIAAGGGLGAMLRYGTTRYLQGLSIASVPLATLVVNSIGCLIMGFCFYVFEEVLAKDGVRLFLLVGFAGAYTTFSAYALELLHLMKSGAVYAALFHMLLHNVLSLGMVFLGMGMASLLWTGTPPSP